MILEPLGDFDAARPAWTALAGRSQNIFATWEWNAVWWRHFGQDRPLMLTLCRSPEGEAFAILPLYLARNRPLRTLRFIGHDAGDHLGPVVAPGQRPAAASALKYLLADGTGGWQVLLAERLPSKGEWGASVGGRTLRSEESPQLTIGGRSWEDFLAGRSSNFRQQVRRRERQLKSRHDVRYRRSIDHGELSQDLDTLFRLHEARWGREGSGVFSGTRGAFHREFAACALAHDWLRLWFLEVDEEPVAAWYGFRFGGADWYYQAGRDPDWDTSSVGFVLLVHSIRDSFESGMQKYRFLRGGEEYKSRFSTTPSDLETLAVGRGAAGRAAVALVDLARRAPRGPRRALIVLAGRAVR